MTDRSRKYYPILVNGQSYLSPIEKRRGGRERNPARSYAEARAKLLQDIRSLRAYMSELSPKLYVREAFVACLRQDPDFIAKSYYPGTLINQAGMKDIGSRKWRKPGTKPDSSTTYGKLFFVVVNEASLSAFEQQLDRAESTVSKEWVRDVRRMESFDVLEPNERIMGFDASWTEGDVELTFHPLPNLDIDDYRDSLRHVMQLDSVQDVKFGVYPGGPLFISVRANKDELSSLRELNPLRSVKPLHPIQLPRLADLRRSPAPPPPRYGERSSIMVGMFDGGVDASSPYLSRYVIANNNCVEGQLNPLADSVRHGTGVAGAILYGDLSQHPDDRELPEPKVTVESFRVLRDDDPVHPYDIIDSIEQVLNARKDIKVFNLSLGPPGAIVDDEVSRFTVMLDTYAHPDRALFTIAAGNDGDLTPPELARIQAPSDSVNSIGVGAYTFDQDNRITRAPYSCIGPGREGAKIKPDLVAFGGCSRRPFHILTPEGQRTLTAGTSFASPVVASIAAELIGRVASVTPLVARALLIHTATHPNGKNDYELGHGVVRNTTDEILNSATDKEVTVLFQSRLVPGRQTRLPIPLPANIQMSGLIEIRWTIATTTPVNPLDSEDYTRACIEETFHPHDQRFRFYAPEGQNGERVLDIVTQADEVEKLLAEGWQQATFPASDSPKHTYLPEHERRQWFKWDTVVRGSVRKRATSLQKPCLVLHAMERYIRGSVGDDIEYAAVVTVSAPKYEGNFYNDILQSFNRLEPIRIRSINELRVRSS